MKERSNFLFFLLIGMSLICGMRQHVVNGDLCYSSRTTFRQELCSHTELLDSDIQPSWCNYSNPFASVPFLFSDEDFELDVEDGAICSTSDPNVFSYMNGTLIDSNFNSKVNYSNLISPRDKCKYISKITTIEVPDVENLTKRYIVLGLISGQIILINFNNGETFHVGKTSDGKNVRTLTAFTNGTDYYIATISYGNSLSLFKAKTFESFSIETCFTIELKNPLNSIRIFEFENSIYLNIAEKVDRETYYLKFYNLKDCSHELEFEILVKSSNSLEFSFTNQKGGFNNALTTSYFMYQRLLLMISSNTQVKIIELQKKNMILDMNEIDSSSFFLTHPGETILSASLAAEEIRRIDFSRSSCLKVYANQAQGLNLIVAIQLSNRTNILKVRNLLEFANYEFFNYHDRNFLNPVGRNGGNETCQVSEGFFFDTSKEECVKSFESFTEIKLMKGETILEMKQRFYNVPSAYTTFFDTDFGKDVDIEKLCETIIRTPELELLCSKYLNNTNCFIELISKYGDLFMQEVLQNYWISQIYISKSGKEILVYGLQQQMCSLNGLILSYFNKISLMGDADFMEITPNSQHLFVTISRERWELQSTNRFFQICKELEKNPDDLFLKPFASSCQSTNPSPVTLNQFGQYTSSCFSGMSCPSFDEIVMDKVPNGFYTIRPNMMNYCEKKYFCYGGSRQLCPQGFKCPFDGMTKPLPCEIASDETQLVYSNLGWKTPRGSETCYSPGSESPQPCLNGSICITPYFPPLPISPGLFLQDNQIKECQLGEYCNLGRFVEGNRSVLECPENTYCEEPSVMEPTICIPNETVSLYCPPGTIDRNPCPQGYHCPSPSRKIECRLTQYCEVGSYVPSPCPAGYYCSKPNVKKICPQGHYCTVGTVLPVACPLFSNCPEGTKSFDGYAIGFLIDLAIIGLVVFTYFIYSISRKFWIRKQEEKRMEEFIKRKLAHITESSYVQTVPKLTVSQIMKGLYKDVKAEISFDNLSLDLVSNNKRILHNLTGKFKSGRLTCIMGPSGSGKTTLLSAILGNASYANVSGDIFVNGTKSSIKDFKNITAFVSQEDCMYRELTVEECIYFSARTRLNFPNKVIDQIVNGVIQNLDLDHIRHSVIGDESKRGISGGQRKRVSIAMELVTCPYILFLDEPTSSLDAYSSFEVAKSMKDIAESGITVVAVLHQPRFEIFQMFDDVVLLGNGGRIVYNGESNQVLNYFETYLKLVPPPFVNPSDFLLDAIYDPEFTYQSQIERTGIPVEIMTCKEMFETWEKFVVIEEKVSGTTIKTLQQEEQARTQNPLIHFYMCVKRSFTLKIRDFPSFFIDCLLVYIGGLSLGLIYLKDVYIGPLPIDIINTCPSPIKKVCGYPLNNPIINVASTVPLVLGLCGIMSSLGTFGSKTVDIVFKKERASGLSVFSFFISKNLEQIPNMVIGPIVFLSIFFSLYSPTASFWEYYLILFLLHFTTFGIGMFVSLTVKLELIQLAGAIFVLVLQLVSGSRPTLTQMRQEVPPLYWFSFVSYIRYAQEALYIIEIRNYMNIFDIQSSLDLFEYKIEDLNYCIGLIPVFGVAFRILSLIIIYQKDEDSLTNSLLRKLSYYTTVSNIKKMFIKKKEEESPLLN